MKSIVEGMVRGMRVRRPYTLSSARHSTDRLRITVKREDQGLFSSWLLDARRQDEPLRITLPRGDFILDPVRGPLVCLVAGIGVTPALALVRTVTDEGLPTRVCVYYSGRWRTHMAGLEELEDAPGGELEEAEERILDLATAARTTVTTTPTKATATPAN